MKKEDLLCYAITDRYWLNGRRLADDVEKSLKGGATFMQLREKELDEKTFREEAVELKALCKKYNVPFVINDNVQIAKDIDADGVHVGQEDMNSGEVRKLLGPEKIIGVSVQTVEMALEAEKNGADYLGVGAMWATSTKDADVVSFETLRDICNAVKIPVVAIGGIKASNAAELKGTGIAGISVISAIFAADDIEGATRDLVKICKENF